MVTEIGTPLSRRIWLTCAGAAVVLLEGAWGGRVLSREHPDAMLGCILVAAYSCIPVVLRHVVRSARVQSTRCAPAL
jgi:hypothetical protein